MSELVLFGIDISQFCSEAKEILQFVGWILTVFKIAIPLLIVGYGMFDFGKAVTGSKEEDIKKSTKSLAYRAVAGVVIFFIPTIVMWLFGAIAAYNEANEKADLDLCQKCILSPWNCD